jgi:hypothetical protein
MNNDDSDTEGRDPRRQSRTRQRRLGLLVGALAALALVAAACGGSSGAKSSSSSGSNNSGSSDREKTLAYSKCMRAHGIEDFPDPDSEGGIGINASPGSNLDPNNPQYQAADKACKHLLPNGGRPQSTSPEQQAERRTAALKYSKCMRNHGIADFPDPNSEGGLEIPSTIDPNNPQFKAADKACKHHLPGGGRGGSTSQSGGEAS